jgi:hypothetical protein
MNAAGIRDYRKPLVLKYLDLCRNNEIVGRAVVKF